MKIKIKIKIKNALKIAVLIALAGILSSCASHKPPQEFMSSSPALSPEEAWKQNQVNLHRIHSWRSEGRIAVSRQHQGESASFIWQQFSDQFLLKLFGPFGSGAMELEGTLTGPNKQVVMRQGNKINYAATAEDLLYQQVKWRVPLSGLIYWAKGVPIPNQPIDKIILNSNGTIKEVNQLGWNITYSQYAQFESNQLPTKMHLINNELEVKLAIRNWSHLK